MRPITVLNTVGDAHLKQVDFPDTCPLCHHGIDARFIGARAINDRLTHFEVAFQCPRGQCGRTFVGRYVTHGNMAKLDGVAPRSPTTTRFSDEISALSPTFVEVYNQAMEAEGQGLDQLTGMGLRKALEFLVKDFAVHQSADKSPEAAAKIRETFLGTVIKDHIADAGTKAAAKRATWLGNDETHYVRKWADKDVEDLKGLLRITVNAVEHSLLMAKYIASMPDTTSAPP